MSGFVRRYTSTPTLEVIRQIEGPVIVDSAPEAPVSGAGTGTVLCVGEYEDGPFATDVDGVSEVTGSSDLVARFGSFGFVYGTSTSQNPCARRRAGELWNGNAYLKLFKLRCQRLQVARVDSSQGSVTFQPLASIDGGQGLFRLQAGQTLAATSSPGGAGTSDAIAAAVVTARGKGTAGFSTIVGGETVGIKLDGGPQVNVVFDSTAITVAAVVARINSVMGQTVAILNGSNVDLVSIRKGYGASIELVDVVAGSLFKIGHIAGLFQDRGRVYGGSATFGSIASGDKVVLTLDGGSPVTTTFSGAPANAAAAALVINAAMGSTVAYAMPLGTLMLQGAIVGLHATAATSGSIQVAAGSPDAAANLGLTVATTPALSNVTDVDNTPVADVVTVINRSTGLSTNNVSAVVGPDGQLRLLATTFGSTLKVTSGALATALGLSPVDVAVSGSTHAAGTIPAGTRVSNGSTGVYVTMQTVNVLENAPGPWTVKVRAALDDGTDAGVSASAITTVVDAPTWANVKVTNPAAIGAALSEAAMDVAYLAAMAATLNEANVSRDANYLLSARRTDAVVRGGKSNVVDATANGLLARKFITRDPLGTTTSQINANVAQFRSDRVFYTGKGLKVMVPAIAILGTAGGLGFTSDGVITVGPDGPLTTLCAMLAPEENPGQATGLIDDFFAVDSFGETLTIESYESYKRNGVAVPRLDRQDGMVFQSGVTSSLVSGRTTMARRKMADFIQDTAANFLAPYIKMLNRQARRDSILSAWNGFLASLLSEQNPSQQRIEAFSVSDGVDAGNTPATSALGVYYVRSVTRTLSSLDNIVMLTEVGENAIVVTEQ